MSIEESLRMTISIFGQCHVMGSDAETFAAGMKNLKSMAEALKIARIEQEGKKDDEHQDKQQ